MGYTIGEDRVLIADASPPSEARDLLAWWSDLLGVIGFFVSLAGFAVALVVRQQVRQARREAANALELFLQQQTLRDILFARQAVLLAREACRGKQWAKAHGHFDVGIEFTTRLYLDIKIPEIERSELQAILDNLRHLSSAVFSRKSESNLSSDRMEMLDSLIQKMTNLEVSSQLRAREARR